MEKNHEEKLILTFTDQLGDGIQLFYALSSVVVVMIKEVTIEKL